jgi:nucleotide-binding universal stress UspA family protein
MRRTQAAQWRIDTGQGPLRSWGASFGAALAPRSATDAIIREVARVGDQYGIEVKDAVRRARSPAEAMQRQLPLGHHNFLVVGVSPRPGEALFFGQVAAELLDKTQCSLLARERAVCGAELGAPSLSPARHAA